MTEVRGKGGHPRARIGKAQLGSAWISLDQLAASGKKLQETICPTAVLNAGLEFFSVPSQVNLAKSAVKIRNSGIFLPLLRLSIRFEGLKDIQRLQSVETEPRDPRNPSKKHWNSREKESRLCRFNGASTVLCRCSKAWRADLMQASSESETIHKLTNSETN